MNKKFNRLVYLSLTLVFLVILAGGTVRMTGSGMGCPDWPKCFGYLIPPTKKTQLEWKAKHEYKKGQVIILNESLKVASQDFTSSETYNPIYWKKYEKHDYAVFNATHTWIEFLNRLLGVLAGFSTLALGIFSFRFWREKKSVVVIAWLVNIAMGIQGWLGKVVVDSVLLPSKITLHMLVAILIVTLLVFLIQKPKPQKYSIPLHFKILALFNLGIILVQIGIGTRVREIVDIDKELVFESSPFLIHRITALVCVFGYAYLFVLLRRKKYHFKEYYFVCALLLFEILLGTIMSIFTFPFATQPLHLTLSTILFGVYCYFLRVFLLSNK